MHGAQRQSLRGSERTNDCWGLIKQSWLESGGVYGYRKITEDLRDLGERCGNHRVYRLMRDEGLRSQTGYRRRRGQRYGQPSVAAPNHVQQQFNVTAPNRVWVTGIISSTSLPNFLPFIFSTSRPSASAPALMDFIENILAFPIRGFSN
jgi:transposase InsO family protein